MTIVKTNGKDYKTVHSHLYIHIKFILFCQVEGGTLLARVRNKMMMTTIMTMMMTMLMTTILMTMLMTVLKLVSKILNVM